MLVEEESTRSYLPSLEVTPHCLSRGFQLDRTWEMGEHPSGKRGLRDVESRWPCACGIPAAFLQSGDSGNASLFGGGLSTRRAQNTPPSLSLSLHVPSLPSLHPSSRDWQLACLDAVEEEMLRVTFQIMGAELSDHRPKVTWVVPT